MASLEHIRYVPARATVERETVTYRPDAIRQAISALPQIFWSSGLPWQEANLWAVERMTCSSVSLTTVESNMRSLNDYAKFLESKGIYWFSFPTRKIDRCIVRYRGALIEARNAGAISPSTAAHRMRVVIQFYRWTLARGLLSANAPLWKDRTIYFKFFDATGFERTITRLTTDLAIPNRTRHGERLEGGLLPVSAADRDALLAFAQTHCTIELYLMLSIGFFTGMRLGTICDLKVGTLNHAVADPMAPGLYRLTVGPGSMPPVHTKFGVTGQIWIPQSLLARLKDYATSTRRLLREAKTTTQNKGTLFLTRFGNTYGRNNSDRSSAINSEMTTVRTIGIRSGLQVLRGFHFHQTRCTFATELARIAISTGDNINAIAIVKDSLLHADEATAFRYIKFIQKTSVKAALADEFTRAFCGIAAPHDVVASCE